METVTISSPRTQYTQSVYLLSNRHDDANDAQTVISAYGSTRACIHVKENTMRELERLQGLQNKAHLLLETGRISEQMRDDLEKLSQALDQNQQVFANLAKKGMELSDVNDSGLRHDLRNIIGISQGYAELIREGDNQRSAKISNLLDKIILWSSRSLAQLELSIKVGRQNLPEAVLPTPDINQLDATILIVDDEPANRDILSRHIRQLGLNTITCSSGDEAFQALKNQSVDLILLDLVMPDIGGHEVLAQLKASTLWRAIPVIVISGMGDQGAVIRCIEAGADDYLQKPFNKTLLRARLLAGLDRKSWVDKERRLTAELEKSQNFIKNTFGRYLSNEIVSNLLDRPDGLNMGGELRTVTILMADIRSFTTISEQLEPQKVVELLNNYLGAMAEIIMAHRGTVDEFIGDAILAVFGAPVSTPEDAENAIRCALAMQAEMADVNQRNQELGLPEVTMGIGINTGEVVAGNIGSKKRAKYGVVGHAVNVTSRIEDQTRSGEVLVSHSTLSAANIEIAKGRSLELQPKGISETVSITEVLGVETK